MRISSGTGRYLITGWMNGDRNTIDDGRNIDNSNTGRRTGIILDVGKSGHNRNNSYNSDGSRADKRVYRLVRNKSLNFMFA
jgi:hypothetical protein